MARVRLWCSRFHLQLGSLRKDRPAPLLFECDFEGSTDSVDTVICLGWRDDLEADWQSGVIESVGQAKRWDACEVRGDGRNVVEVHRNRIVELVTELERRGGRRR